MDAQTPMDPPPSDVNFNIDTAAAGGRGGRGRGRGQKAAASGPVALAPEPKADDPAGACRFASKPGSYQLDGLRGILSARVNGQEVSVNYSGGR